jgi:preprotein translocase subunit SecE
MEEGEVAERNRRGKRAVDEHLDDEVFADAVDDETLDPDYADADAIEDDIDEDDLDKELVTAGSRSNGRAGTVTKGAKSATSGRTDKTAKSPSKVDEKPNIFERIARFIREVVAEMRKVNWPSRKELLTYTSVVLVFVIVMMSIVGVLDYAFAWAVGHVFAGNK